MSERQPGSISVLEGTTSGESHDLRLEHLRRKDDRPNILLLMTDQQRYDTLGANGASFARTPNIDALAAGGCNFTRAYSPNPICAPARHNLLTGLTARYHGIPDNVWGRYLPRELPTIPQVLAENGYETRAIGKNHFFPPRRHNGYDRIELMEEVPGFREEDDYLLYLKQVGLGNVLSIHGVRHLLYMVPQRSIIPEEHHGTRWVADRAIDFIETNNGRHPWFLKVSWIAPHPPFDVPDEFATIHGGDGNPDSPIPEPVRSNTPVSPLARENMMLGDLPGKRYVTRVRQLYHSAVSHVDHHVGRVLAALERTGQASNTLVIFTSDHGEMLGDHGTFQKWLPYEACCRIPFIMRFPGRIPAGTTYNGYVDLNDVFPTILDATGIKYPGKHELPGDSLLKPGSSHRDRSVQFIEYGEGSRRWVSIQDGRYKYNYYYGGGLEELFDLETDPYETTNLLHPGGTPASDAVTKIMKGLRARLVALEARWGLAGYVKDGEFITLPRYIPRPYRNRAFPIFQEKITDPREKAAMNSIFDEVLVAIEKEPVVDLEELDLAAWKANGRFTDEQIRELVRRAKEMRARRD